jgi:hypothetical protein
MADGAHMQNKRDMGISGLLILLGIGVIIYSTLLGIGTLLRPQPGFFPFLIGFCIIMLSVILLYLARLGRTKAPQPFVNWHRPLLMVVSLAVYAITLKPLGYILSTIFIATVTLRIMAENLSWKVIGLVSFALSVTIYFFFTRALEVDLPTGILSFLG